VDGPSANQRLWSGLASCGTIADQPVVLVSIQATDDNRNPARHGGSMGPQQVHTFEAARDLVRRLLPDEYEGLLTAIRTKMAALRARNIKRLIKNGKTWKLPHSTVTKSWWQTSSRKSPRPSPMPMAPSAPLPMRPSSSGVLPLRSRQWVNVSESVILSTTCS
jgi:hypothetical protein